MTEEWRGVIGYEDRYEVSSEGRIRTVSFLQRYLLRTGEESYRRTKVRFLSKQLINSGYYISHLHRDGKRKAFLVHRLVSEAFLGAGEVNHINGVKTDNRLENLQIVTRTENHLHAVRLRLNKQAVRVSDPSTGICYFSIAQAARHTRRSIGWVSTHFIREG